MMRSNNLSLLKSAGMISILGAASSFLALAIQMLLAKEFGASFRMDAYFAAIGIPRIVMRLIGLPLNQVVTPIFKEIESHNKDEALKFASAIFWGLFLIFTLIGSFIFLQSELLARFIVPGTSLEITVLTGSILKLLALYLVFSGVYYTSTAILLSQKIFHVPYIANMVSNLIAILYTVYFIADQGIFAVVYGLTLGSFVQMIINLAYIPSIFLKAPKIPGSFAGLFFSLFLPLSIGSFLYRSTPVVDRYFASFLPDGSISLIGYGFLMLESIVAFISSGLSVVLLPITSELSARKQDDKLSSTLSWGLRAVIILIIPTLFYIGFFGQFFVGALFERGQFLSFTSKQVSTILLAYSGAFFALSIGSQFTNIFYAQKKHVHVVLINLFFLPLYIMLLYYFSKNFGAVGIALSYSIYTSLTVISYLYFTRDMIRNESYRMAGVLWRCLIASSIMVLVLMLQTKLLLIHIGSPALLVVHIVTGTVVYFISLYYFQVREIQALVLYGRERLSKR